MHVSSWHGPHPHITVPFSLRPALRPESAYPGVWVITTGSLLVHLTTMVVYLGRETAVRGFFLRGVWVHLPDCEAVSDGYFVETHPDFETVCKENHKVNGSLCAGASGYKFVFCFNNTNTRDTKQNNICVVFALVFYQRQNFTWPLYRERFIQLVPQLLSDTKTFCFMTVVQRNELKT